MERLGSSFPCKLTVRTVHPSNGIGSLTAHTSRSFPHPSSSRSGLTSISGRYFSFHTRSTMLTCAPVSSNALTVSPLKLHWVNALLPISLIMVSVLVWQARCSTFRSVESLFCLWCQWSKVLFSDESKFCISFGNQGPRVCRKGGEAHSPSCLKSSVKFPQSVMIWGAMSSAGVGPLCF